MVKQILRFYFKGQNKVKVQNLVNKFKNLVDGDKLGLVMCNVNTETRESLLRRLSYGVCNIEEWEIYVVLTDSAGGLIDMFSGKICKKFFEDLFFRI